jgi:hypothetical protein
MTNKQYLCILDIQGTIQAITSIQYVGLYPDDLSLIGQRFPAVIIEDGDETYDIVAGNVYHCDMVVKVHLYIHLNTNTTKMKSMLDYQALINDAVLEDLTLGGNAVNIKLTEVEKETIENEPGVQLSHRILKYTVEIHDTRV